MADGRKSDDARSTEGYSAEPTGPFGPPDITPGDLVGKYEIIEEIGRGGMGVVYRARNRDLENDVALKCPYPHLAQDPMYRKRFLREARAYSRLSGPNIVHVFDAFEHDGLPWLALQLIDGPSLEEVLVKEGKIEPRRALGFAEDLANALDVAHDHGVLHRDIKPQNVLIAHDGRALLTDFGLARFIPTDGKTLQETTTSSITETGAIIGTVRYMPPEQTLGKEVDPRSDIYSWGAIVYEMVTGHPLFSERKLGSLIDQIMHHEPMPISRFTYEVPDEFERIIRKAMAKDPRDRYQGTKDLLVDLRTLRRELDGESSIVLTETRRSSLPLWIVAVGLLSVAAAFALWFASRPTVRPLPEAVPFQVTNTEGWQGHPALSPDGSRIAYAGEFEGNEDIYIVSVRGGDPIRLTDDPAEDTHPAWFPDGSRLAFTSLRGGSAGIWTVGQFGGGAVELIENAGHPAVSHDGTRIAFVRPDTASHELRVYVAPIDDPTAAVQLSGDQEGLWGHTHPTWSSNDDEVGYSSRHGLWVVGSTGGRSRQVTSADGYDFGPVWSPTGFLYFASDRDGPTALWRAPADGSGPIQRVSLGTASERDPTLSADGRVLAYATSQLRRRLVLLDRSTGARDTIPSSAEDYQVAISRAGDLAAFVSARESTPANIWLQRLHDGELSGRPTRLTFHDGRVSHPAFSPTGDFIAYYVIDDGNRDLWCTPTSGGQAVRLTEDPASDIHPSWSPDGNAIVFVSERDGSSAIWTLDVVDGRRRGDPRKVVGGEVDCLFPAVSPDGSRIAYIGYEGNTTDLWVTDGDGLGTRVTNNAEARIARWGSTGLWVTGAWGGSSLTLRRAYPDGGDWAIDDPSLVVAPVASAGAFDISTDERLVVFAHEERTGNIWVLPSQSAIY